mgnify:CR=1 FL=1
MYNNFSNYLNSYNNNPYNPVGNVAGINSPYQPQRQEIIKVNGREGANAFGLAPNSAVLLLDINQPIIYLKQTDGGGYANVTAYTITPFEQEQKISFDTTDLEKRIKRLEELYESYTLSVEQLKQSKPTQSSTKH